MKLIGSLVSPYVRKVRVVLAEKKIEHQFILEDVWAEDTEIYSFNPLGKVPCLIMEDNGALFDSNVIVEYLDTLTPIGKLIPQTGRERAEVRCWEALSDGVIEALVNLNKDAALIQSCSERQWYKIMNSVKAMDKGLGERNWCYRTHMTLADIAVGCALDYLNLYSEHAPSDFLWKTQHPNLERLLTKLNLRPSFATTAILHV